MPDILRDPPRLPLIAPSILSADFANMAAECRSVLDAHASTGDAGRADLLHLDVMDGHFVPNLTMGPDLCRWLRKAFPETALDVHLMVTNPALYILPFADAGADHLTFHVEPASPEYRDPFGGGGGGPRGKGYHPAEVAEEIRRAGMTAGIAINPPTDPAELLDLVPHFDMVLVMSVNPGFSGQSFIEEVLETVRLVKPRLRDVQRLEMDGGINPKNAAACREAGCDVLVAASAVFGQPRDGSGARNKVIASLRGD